MCRIRARALVRALVLACLLALLWPTPVRAADAPPAAPPSVTVSAGVDGALVRWGEQFDAGLTGYQVQRATAAADAPWADLAWVASEAPRRYLDPAAAGETWAYRVLAMSPGGASPPSLARTVKVPPAMPAGDIDGLAVTSSASPIPAGGGAYFAPRPTR